MNPENFPQNQPPERDRSKINWYKDIEVLNEKSGEVEITNASGEVERRFLRQKTAGPERKGGEELSAIEKLRSQSEAEYQRVLGQAHQEAAQKMERYRNTLIPSEFDRELEEALQKKAEQLAQIALERKE